MSQTLSSAAVVFGALRVNEPTFELAASSPVSAEALPGFIPHDWHIEHLTCNFSLDIYEINNSVWNLQTCVLFGISGYHNITFIKRGASQ